MEQALPAQSTASSPQVRASMRGNRYRDTKPELKLRSMLHRRGLRYRVDARPIADLPRRADVVFPSCRVAVFVDGCYWHGCPDHYRPATKNRDFWQNKIDMNRARDSDTNRILNAAGWTVLRVWEHEDLTEAARAIETIVRAKRHSTFRHSGGSDGSEYTPLGKETPAGAPMNPI
ncbi:very short patch repair endonuclease [Rhodococcus pyridinivorans]|uniref:very short patch repair endonuclease n=1 Tax=Rhodococcus pyridinivorans TaxID=103816 RepID=UPI003685EC82